MKNSSKLPNPFGNSIKVNEEEVDDEAKHDGRTRNFPHERGNWVTYIYVHCKKKKDKKRMFESLNQRYRSNFRYILKVQRQIQLQNYKARF